MRALIIDLSLRYGGTDVRVTQIARGLASRAQVKVAVLAGSETEQRFRAAGIDVVAITRNRKDPRIVGDLVGLIRQFAPDVVDAHNPQSLLWGLAAAARAGVPNRIATLHSVFEQSERPGLRQPFYRVLSWLVRRTATEVVTVSEGIRDHAIASGIDARKVHLLYNGVETPPVTALRRTDQPLRIAVVGRMVAVKGHAVLLQALNARRAELGPFQCIFIGDGEERAKLEALVEHYRLGDAVRFLGYRTDVNEQLCRCQIFCMPSFTEGLPYAALEAAALRLAIVASRVGGLAQHFEHGVNARLVPAGDAEALAAELVWCAVNREDASELGEAALRLVKTRFSVNAMIDATFTLYGSETVQRAQVA